MYRSDGDYDGLHGIDHSARHTLQSDNHLSGHIDWIYRFMWRGSMTPLSDYSDLERVKGCGEGTRSEAEDAGVVVSGNVEPEYVVDLGILHDSVFDHWFCSTSSAMFLGGLEEEFHGALELVFMIGEKFCGSEEHGYVCIMSTGVHYSFDFGLELDISHLIQWKSIHIRPKSDDPTLSWTIESS